MCWDGGEAESKVQSRGLGWPRETTTEIHGEKEKVCSPKAEPRRAEPEAERKGGGEGGRLGSLGVFDGQEDEAGAFSV